MHGTGEQLGLNLLEQLTINIKDVFLLLAVHTKNQVVHTPPLVQHTAVLSNRALVVFRVPVIIVARQLGVLFQVLHINIGYELATVAAVVAQGFLTGCLLQL